MFITGFKLISYIVLAASSGFLIGVGFGTLFSPFKEGDDDEVE